MKVRALVSFAGRLSMAAGEEREIESKEVLNDLLKAGYVEPCDEPEAAQSAEGEPKRAAKSKKGEKK
jgi:hypothetical protein